MKIRILVDNYKMDIFRKHLKANDYEWETTAGPVPETTFVLVHTDNAPALQNMCIDANMEARRKRN